MSYCWSSLKLLQHGAQLHRQQHICAACGNTGAYRILTLYGSRDGVFERRRYCSDLCASEAFIGKRIRKDAKYPADASIDPEELGAYLYKALKLGTIPGLVAYTVPGSSYLFMSKTASEAVQSKRNEAVNAISKATNRFYGILDDTTLTPKQKNAMFVSEMKARGDLNVLKQEYKIHLQVKPQYVTEVLSALLSDDEFLEDMKTIKVLSAHNRVEGSEALPMIVVYPDSGVSSAQKTISVITETLNSVFTAANLATMGWGVTPRYNQRYDNFTYYANGGGDVKANYEDFLKRTGQKNLLYTQDFTRFKGTKRLI